MNRKESSNKTAFGEVVGFGAGCLVGGLAGALAGLLWQSEWAVMACYAVGLTAGGLFGGWIVRRLSRSGPAGK
jgi:hypothetical protein